MAYLVSELSPTQGFHPTSASLVYLPGPIPQYESCSLHLYYSLPPPVFVDTHELGQRSSSYTFSHWGSRDLEKPVHALPQETSEVLINVQIPQEGYADEEEMELNVEVPMHLRYGTPRSTATSKESEGKPYEEIQVEWPHAFLLCSSTSLLKSRVTQPSLPAHILAALPSRPPRKLIPIPPHSNFTKTTTTLLLPLGNPYDLAFVEPFTAMTVFICFLWIVRVAWKTSRRTEVDTSSRPKTD
ncbi:unnamed protein product [Cyclocybe aegerita]|uniref:Protein PBN1 n=1 Tax=Cyclocybe aegerita TaxID=1973307 RepID=A0A8S0VR30_CYCAE|nr:unnamed protein product [Cyclocybe aegerita]